MRDEGFAVFVETVRNLGHILSPFLNQTAFRRQCYDTGGETSHMIR